MKNKIQLLTILLLLFVNIKAQSPYKINPNTGGYLLDNSGQPVRSDKNWDVVNLKFVDEFGTESNSITKWNYYPNEGRPFFEQNDLGSSPLSFVINDLNDGDNSPECSSPYSVIGKKSHYYGTTSGITSCILRLKKENFQGFYNRFDTISCLSSNVGFRKQLTKPNWFKFTAGLLTSKTTYRLGWFELKCRLKTPEPTLSSYYDGIGYNFWLYNSSEAKYSEIDIFETDMSRSLMTSNTHLNTVNGSLKDPNYMQNRADPNSEFDCYGKQFMFDKEVNMYNFHTFSLEWLNNNVTTYYDNERAMQYRFREKTGAEPSLFNSMYIILGFGTPYFCKNPIKNVSNGMHELKDSVPAIVDYEIDYVKVYKLICTNTTDVIQSSNTTYNFNNYTYGVKNNIIFGGINCVAKITNGSNVSLRAKTSIELKAGFEVEAGAEFYANICDCTP